MPVSTEQERILLNKYHLTSLHPTEWPHENDDDNSSEEEEEERGASKASLSNGHARNMSTSSNSARYQKISRHASIEGRKHTDAGIQKDEPDALGKAQSVVSELRRRGLPVEENSALRNKFMLSSTSFNPGLYLTQVHQDATMSDLMRGLDFLSKGIEQKSASLKVLVESNFERFVRAKATIDAVYTEMRTQGVEPQPVSQGPGSLSASHSRQTSRNHTHFRNTSGAFSVQSKTPTVDKRKNALTKESDYGVQGIKIPLHEVMIKADEVWGPALGGREREETLKSVVLALDHHRDVIQLSGTVFEAIQKNDYDGVAEAHKQATQHAEKARRIADTAKRNNVDLRDGEVQQIIITAKMWHDVSQQIESFKSQIWRRLKTSHGRKTTVQTSEPDKEEHMELIGVLMRLDVDENPIWEWINSRFLYLKNEMTRFFERSRVEIEILRRKLANGRPTDNEALARHLRSASAAAGNLRRSKETSRDMDVTMVLAFWDKVHASLTTLLSPQTGILGEIVEWWETAQSFIDGKAQKAFPTAVFNAGLEHLELDPDHVQNIRLGAVELVTTLRESIMSFFSDAPVEDLGDLYSPMPPTPITPGSAKAASPGSKRSFNFDMSNIPPPPSPRRGDVLDKFAFWAPNSNSLSGSHYLGRLLALVGSGASELAGLSVIRQGSNETEKMKTLVGTVRERCIQAICVSWNADAEKCRVLESWQLNAERRDITLMPAYYAAWEEQVLANVQKIAYISDAATRKGGANGIDVIFPPPAKLLQAVKGCFVTSLYKALSGMVENAEKMKNDGSVDADADGVVVARQPTVAEDGVQATEVVDASNKNVRMLLTLSNLNYLRSESIPQLVSQFEAAFSVNLTEENKTIRDVLSQIDARLFQSYVKPTVDQLSQIITDGVGGASWEPRSSRPTNASAYVYDVLLTLVLVHSEVTSTTTSALPNQILSYLLEQCSLALINAFKQRSRYTLPALMQATLDVEFMAQTLNNYTTDRASEIQSQIYLALDERTDNEARAQLQGELPEMRSTLKRLREGTKGEFGCFRRERRGREGRSGTATAGSSRG